MPIRPENNTVIRLTGWRYVPGYLNARVIAAKAVRCILTAVLPIGSPIQ